MLNDLFFDVAKLYLLARSLSVPPVVEVLLSVFFSIGLNGYQSLQELPE